MVVETNNNTLYNQISVLITEARQAVVTQVNTTLLTTYWNIGRLIVEDEQVGRQRAEYGKQTLKNLSRRLTQEFGTGFSRSNLQTMRLLYLKYPKCQTVPGKLSWSHYAELLAAAEYALCGISNQIFASRCQIVRT